MNVTGLQPVYRRESSVPQFDFIEYGTLDEGASR